MPDDTVVESMSKQIAALAVTGINTNQISQQLGITRPQVKRILAMPQTKLLISELGDTAMATAVSQIKTRTARLVDKALIALEHNLDKNDLEAVKLIFRTVGADKPPETGPSDTSITIIAPGGTKIKENTQDAEFTVVEGEEDDL